MDGEFAGLANHATEVAGVLVAAGVGTIGGIAGAAHGMASMATVRSYSILNANGDQLNDIAEIGADNLIQVSNHSYGAIRGWATQQLDCADGQGNINTDVWFGDTLVSNQEDNLFGKYTQRSRDFDQILFNDPDLVAVFAAGNDRNALVDSFRNQRGNGRYFLNRQGVCTAAVPAPQADGAVGNGYDTLPDGPQTAKTRWSSVRSS